MMLTFMICLCVFLYLSGMAMTWLLRDELSSTEIWGVVFWPAAIPWALVRILWDISRLYYRHFSQKAWFPKVLKV